MNISSTTNAGTPMPALMNFTPATRIEEADDIRISYNDIRQITEYDTRTLGTRSYKVESTRKKVVGTKRYTTTTDRKNAIDDTKTVK